MARQIAVWFGADGELVQRVTQRDVWNEGVDWRSLTQGNG